MATTPRQCVHSYNVRQRPVAGQVIGNMSDNNIKQPQDPTFHAEAPQNLMYLPSHDQTARSLPPDEHQWTLHGRLFDDPTSSWQHSGANQLQFGEDSGSSWHPIRSDNDVDMTYVSYRFNNSHDDESAYSSPLTSNEGYFTGGDWGMAALRYANRAVPTHEGELNPGIIALGAHSAYAQTSTAPTSTIMFPSTSGSQNQLTLAIRPLCGGETQPAEGIRSNEIQAASVETSRLNVPKSQRNIRLPPTPTLPPASAAPSTGVVAASNEDPIDPNSNILQIAKREIHRIMLTQLAVPHQCSQRQDMIQKVLDTALSISGIPAHQRPQQSTKCKLIKALVDAMARIRLAFRNHARFTIEGSYDLLPDIMSGIDEVEYKRGAVEALLHNNLFLHKFLSDTNSIYYLENKAVTDLIVYVVWKKLRCGDLIMEAHMDSVFGLAAAGLKVALMEHSTGVHNRMSTHLDRFTETYYETIQLIEQVIRADVVYGKRYALLCKNIVERGRKLWSHDNNDSNNETNTDD